MGPEVEHLMYANRVPKVRPLVYANRVPKVRVSSRITWCSSLLADSLGSVATLPNTGLVLIGILYLLLFNY